MIAGRDAPTHGEAKNSWLTGTAAWNYVAASQWIVGIRPEHDGLRIDPCLPAAWGDISATRRFRGHDVPHPRPEGSRRQRPGHPAHGRRVPGRGQRHPAADGGRHGARCRPDDRGRSLRRAGAARQPSRARRRDRRDRRTQRRPGRGGPAVTDEVPRSATGEYHGLPTRRLQNERLWIDVLAAAGPRIIRLGVTGSDRNLLAETPDMGWETPTGRYELFGGHRLWFAPEDPDRVAVPDTDGLLLQAEGTGLRLTGTAEPQTGLVRSIVVRLDATAAALTLRHELCNTGVATLELAPWAITQLPLGGRRPDAAADGDGRPPCAPEPFARPVAVHVVGGPAARAPRRPHRRPGRAGPPLQGRHVRRGRLGRLPPRRHAAHPPVRAGRRPAPPRSRLQRRDVLSRPLPRAGGARAPRRAGAGRSGRPGRTLGRGQDERRPPGPGPGPGLRRTPGRSEPPSPLRRPSMAAPPAPPAGVSLPAVADPAA